MKLPWPEIESATRSGETIRSILDYLVWIARAAQARGFHAGPDQRAWRQRAQKAYDALFVPPVPHYGDPYPPDVPPARSPGVWPDVPALRVTGMTVRHQLKVIGLLAAQLREEIWLHARDEDLQAWDLRLGRAREALDHGETLPMPDEERTEPSEEALAAARAQERQVKALARKRSRRLRQLRDQARRRKAARAKAARKAVSKKKTATKKTATKTKAAKKPAKKKATKKKATKKKATKKKAVRAKKTPSKKAAKKPSPRKKKPAAKKKPAKKKPTRKTTRRT